uniref:Putative secreted protein n=1 Tax=Xenopsylla cheopis TaxID=163159 RepID=A0A6M2E1Z6_XENCH
MLHLATFMTVALNFVHHLFSNIVLYNICQPKARVATKSNAFYDLDRRFRRSTTERTSRRGGSLEGKVLVCGVYGRHCDTGNK